MRGFCQFGLIWVFNYNLENLAKNCSMSKFKSRSSESEIFRNGSISINQR